MAAANALRNKITSIFGAAGSGLAAAAAGGAGRAAAAAVPQTADSVVLVNATMNNIHVCVSDLEGQVVSKASGGLLGLKHRARASPQAAQEITAFAVKKAVEKGFRVAHVHVKGPSRGRGMALRGITDAGMKIEDIRDVTPMPTNGCRPPSARRL